MALTELEVKSAKPEAKARKLADGLGMYLLIQPTGSKLWRLKYRFGGTEKVLALGQYPQIGLKDARAARDEARKLLANGADPGQVKKAQKVAQSGADTFEAIAREWHAKHVPTWSASNAAKIMRRLEVDVFPWVGSRPINTLTAPDLLTMLRRIEDRGALETAHRALSNTGMIFRYAVATGRTDRNPAADLRGALPPTKPTHFGAITEPAQAAGLLRAIDGYAGSLVTRAALRLAPLIFVRPGELRAAQWEDFDLEAGEWRYIVSKTNTPHIVPLSKQALAILRELHPLTGGGRYLFPGERTRDRPISENTVNAALRRMGFEGKDMTGHGFRAMARTILDEVLGFRPDFIEHQLAHAVKDPNGRAYNRTAHLPERRKMMQAWADYLDKLKEGKGANVTTLKSKRTAPKVA